MSALLNFISVAAAFVFGVGVLYWVMDVTVGKLKFLHSEKEWHGLQAKDLAFLLLAIILLLNFTTFYKPY